MYSLLILSYLVKDIDGINMDQQLKKTTNHHITGRDSEKSQNWVLSRDKSKIR